jgi:hypothetical protein
LARPGVRAGFFSHMKIFQHFCCQVKIIRDNGPVLWYRKPDSGKFFQAVRLDSGHTTPGIFSQVKIFRPEK